MQQRSRSYSNDIRRFFFSIFVIFQCVATRSTAFLTILSSKSMPMIRHMVVVGNRVVPPANTHQRPQTKYMMTIDAGNDLTSLHNLLLSAVTSQTEPWVQPLSNMLDPALNFMSFAMLSRVVLSWYPDIVASNKKDNEGISGSSLPLQTLQPQQPPQQKEISSTAATVATDSTEATESNTVPESASPRPTVKSEQSTVPIWIKFIIIPTQPLLQIVKGIVPPAFGVDITPIFWLAIFTFIHEILLGQQGLLTMKIKYGI